jgi:hypothetical protein
MPFIVVSVWLVASGGAFKAVTVIDTAAGADERLPSLATKAKLSGPL